MTNQTGNPAIDDILETMRGRSYPAPPDPLDEQAFELCYAAIRQSGLYAQLECAEWDALAQRLRGQVRAFIDEQIDAELTRIEAEKKAERELGY